MVVDMIFDEIFTARSLVCLSLIASGLVFMNGKILHYRSRESRIGNFNNRNKILDRNANNNSRMDLILDNIINRHGLYIKTNTDFTYQQ